MINDPVSSVEIAKAVVGYMFVMYKALTATKLASIVPASTPREAAIGIKSAAVAP